MTTATKKQPVKQGELVTQEQQVGAMVAQSGELMNRVIELSSNPDFDPSKLERLIDLYHQQQERVARLQYDQAMARCQAKLDPVRTDMYNSETKSRYASSAAQHQACQQAASEEGFSLNFDTAPVWRGDDPYLLVMCHISHQGGHTASRSIEVPADGKGPKGGAVMTRTHAVMSATTYGMKKLREMIFNLPADQRDDDDGNSAGVAKITTEQEEKLLALIKKYGLDGQAALDHLKLQTWDDLPARNFSAVMRQIQARGEAQGK